MHLKDLEKKWKPRVEKEVEQVVVVILYDE